MAFNISEINNAVKDGVLKTDLFHVYIPFRSSLHAAIDISKTTPFLCEAVNLPGVTLNTASIYRYGIGPTQEFPIGASFTNLGMTLIGDGKGVILNAFHNWMNQIYSFNSSYGVFNLGADLLNINIDSNPFTGSPYLVEYKDNYVVDIIITVYDTKGNQVVVYKVMDAYPISMPDISMSWRSDGLMQIPVTFTFRDWNVRYYKFSSIDNLYNRINQDIFDNTYVNTVLETIKDPVGAASSFLYKSF